MPSHSEIRILPYTQEQMFNLVADIERYPEFLPWCMASRIRKRTGNLVHADLVVGVKMIRETFTSRVQLTPHSRIDMMYTEGPFEHMNGRWIFRNAQGGCSVDFHVDFEFKSSVLQKIIQALFTEAVHRMVAAFDKRARQLYGPSLGEHSFKVA